MSKKRKRKNSNKNLSKRIKFSFTVLIVLTILIIGIGYYFYGNDVFKIGINDKTLNYISFNDIFDSDTIKIDNIYKLSDKKGKRQKPIDLNLKSDENIIEYEILLIPINVNIDYKYIKYYLVNDDDEVFDSLNNSYLSNDSSGNVIYTGMINKKDKLKLRVWIDNNYKGEDNINSFEVKVKLK